LIKEKFSKKILVEVLGRYSNQALQSQKLSDLLEHIASTQIRIRVISKPKPPRRKLRRLSTTQLEGLAKDYRSGMPLREIAAKYRVHRDTVNEHIRRMGLSQRHQRRRTLE
jgi:DNA-binding NarL/FixJ family response regulator